MSSRSSRTWSSVIVVVLVAAVSNIGALAINEASAQEHWPGAFDLIRRHPFPAAGVLTLVAALLTVALRQLERVPILGTQPVAGVAIRAATFRGEVIVDDSDRVLPEDTRTSSRTPVGVPSLADTQVVVGEIPRAAPGFQERQRLMERLTRSESSSYTAIQVIVGGHGVGKTQLAAAYARRRIADRWPVVAWINAETEGLLVAGWEQLADELGARPTDGDPESAARAARAHLARLDGPSLLVFDNATDADVAASWLPNHGKAQVLLTSTNRGLADFGEPLDVDLFTEEEALTFLHNRVGLEDEEGARELVVELDRLPLALAQAAAVIRREHLSYATYLNRLRTFPVDHYLTRPAGDPYPRGAAQAMLLAVIDAEEADPTGVTWALLQMLSLLSPSGTHRRLLQIAGREMLPDRGEMQIDAEVDKALGVLAESSILTLSVDGSTVFMHRLLSRVLQDRSADQDWRLGILIATCQALEVVTVHGGSAWPERAQAEHLVDQIEALYKAAQSVDLGPQEGERIFGLRRWAAGYVFHIADASRAASVCAALIADLERALGAEHESIVPLRTYLASSYLSAERFEEAIELLKEKYEGDCIDFGPEDQFHTAASRLNLASAYEKARQFDRALGLYEEALNYRKMMLGAEHPLTLCDQTKLASALNAIGRSTAAINSHKATISACERVLGMGHWITLEAQHALAAAYMRAGHLNEAILLQHAMLANSDPPGSSNFSAAMNIRLSLIRTYRAAERWSDVIATCKATLALVEPTFYAHPKTLTVRFELAHAERLSERTGAAVKSLEALLIDTERIFGPDHTNTSECRSELEMARRGAARGRFAKRVLELLLRRS